MKLYRLVIQTIAKTVGSSHHVMPINDAAKAAATPICSQVTRYTTAARYSGDPSVAGSPNAAGNRRRGPTS